jgi:PII-like signaling protein
MGLGHIGTIQSKENARDHDLPVLIEAIDSPEKINSFIPIAVKLLGNHGLIMTAEVKVVHQGKLYAVPKSPEIKSYD